MIASFPSFGYAPLPEPGPSAFIASLQADLAAALGMPLAPTGFLDAMTRRALRIFQSRERLPVTGTVTGSTIRALRQTALPPPPPPEPPPPPGFDDSAPSTGGDWLPPESGGDGASAQEPVEEEYRITTGGDIKLHRRKTLHVGTLLAGGDIRDLPTRMRSELPADPGIYVIHDGKKPWYVGIASESIAKRFTSRAAALKDFNLTADSFKDSYVTPYVLTGAAVRAAFIQKNGLERPYNKKDQHDGVLSALETHFIKALKTADKGNVRKEVATIAKNQSAALTIGGAANAPSWEPSLGTALVLNAPKR